MQPVKKNERKKIFFGNRIDHWIYTIYKNNKEFIDLNDAQQHFTFLFCKKDQKGWRIDQYELYSVDSVLYDCSVTGTGKIYEYKIFIRHENYKNILKLRGELSGAVDINELREAGYVEIDLKENNDETGFKYKLIDCNGNLISYAVDDQSESESSRLNN